MMKHRSTIAIFSEWQRLAFDQDGRFRAPPRKEIRPRQLGQYLPDLFFLETDATGDLVFRLGGTRICTLYGREVKGLPFTSLWPEHDHRVLNELTQEIAGTGIPATSLHDGVSVTGRRLHFEMLVAALESHDGQSNFIGSIAVLDSVSWLGADPLVFGHLESITPLAPDFALDHTSVADESPARASRAVNARPYQRIWTEPQALDHRVASKPHLQLIKGGKV